MPHMSAKSVASGFTLIEVMIVTVLVGIAVTLVYTVMDGFYGSTELTLGQATQSQNAQDSLAQIEQDVGTATRFAATTAITDPAYVQIGGMSAWSYQGSSNSLRTLILEKPATSTAAEKTLVYLPSPTTGCSEATISNNPYLVYYHVYFVKDATLWRRTVIANAVSAPRCPGYDPVQRQTCQPAQSGAFCSGTDAKIATGVKSFDVQYYANPNDSAPIAAYSDSTLLSNTVSTVNLTLSTQAKIYGAQRDFTYSVRTSKLN